MPASPLRSALALLLSLGLSFNVTHAQTPAKELNTQEYETAAAAGDLEAMFMLGTRALQEEDVAKSLTWIRKAAAGGHAAAQAGLGFHYYNGYGCDKDLAKARELYEKSAAAGAHQGLNNLAHLYRHGVAGVDKDLPKAIGLLEKAARLGNYKAAHSLIEIYLRGEAGQPDREKALEWSLYGAEHFSPSFYGIAGDLHLDSDPAIALKYYQKGVDENDPDCLCELGLLFRAGAKGVPQDHAAAVKLLQQAVDAGNPMALIPLAKLRRDGLGCEIDLPAAVTLLEIAEKKYGSRDAALLLYPLRKKPK